MEVAPVVKGNVVCDWLNWSRPCVWRASCVIIDDSRPFRFGSPAKNEPEALSVVSFLLSYIDFVTANALELPMVFSGFVLHGRSSVLQRRFRYLVIVKHVRLATDQGPTRTSFASRPKRRRRHTMSLDTITDSN